MGKERRRSTRVRQRVECEIQLGKSAHPATLLDVSEGGLAAVCTEELPVGLAGTISFRVLGRKVEVKALVWHCRQVRFRGDTAFAYGFMLEEASDTFQELLPVRQAGAAEAAEPSRPVPSKTAPTTGARGDEKTSSAPPTTAKRPVSKSAVRAAQADGPKGKRLAHLRAELDDSLRENRRETPGTAFRVRAKMRTQPRTKTLTLSVTSEGEARTAVQKQLGPEWEILEISAA